MMTDEVITCNLKEWLSWKDDDAYEGKINYIRVMTIPDKDEILLMRHIAEHKKTRIKEVKKIEYSILTKLSGKFSANALLSSGLSDRDRADRLNKHYQVFSFHHTDAYTINTFLELFCLKKSDKIRINYYPKNDSDFIREKLNGYSQESIVFTFTAKNKVYEVSCDHIPNADCTRYIAENPEGYHIHELYKDKYPETIAEQSCTVKEQSAVIEA